MDGLVQQQIIQAKDYVLRAFPDIDRARLEITSPETGLYNCIAYAADDTRRWWWPDKMGTFYWPPGIQRSETIIVFQRAFETLGYVISPDSTLEQGIEKIGFFHKQNKPTHAAKQLQDGAWTSKLGQSFDISHDLEGLQGDEYGRIALIMKRPKS